MYAHTFITSTEQLNFLMQDDQSQSCFLPVLQRTMMCMHICRHCWQTDGRENQRSHHISALLVLQNYYTALNKPW